MVQFGRVNLLGVGDFSGSAVSGGSQVTSSDGVDYLLNKYFSGGDLESLVVSNFRGLSDDELVKMVDSKIPPFGFIEGLDDSYKDAFVSLLREKLGSATVKEVWKGKQQVSVIRDGKGRFVSWKK